MRRKINMTSILMVCLGNICRSPLAHGILESKLPSDKFYVDSAGTANYHVGLDFSSILLFHDQTTNEKTKRKMTLENPKALRTNSFKYL